MNMGIVTFSTIVLYAAVFVVADDCPELYKRYSDNHSYCRTRNQSCEILAFYPSKDDIDNILQLHNNFRNDISKGKKSLPSASNMLQLEWDDELASVAQKYADQCIYAHDCANCRRVMNFGVGQNIAIQRQTGGHSLPTPDWKFAVNDWFAEIMYFSPDLINNFKSPENTSKEYRHFTQIIWANSFRIGCGYVLYKEEGNELFQMKFTRLYICNYGPAGNVYQQSVYETGSPCSNCPENSCCNCDSNAHAYSALCFRNGDEAPFYKPKQDYLFYCDFRNNSDCNNYIVGGQSWYIEDSLGGNYLEVVLDGGENSTLAFSKHVSTNAKAMCLAVEYRKGSNTYGDKQNSVAQEQFYFPSNGYFTNQNLPDYPEGENQQYSVYNETMNWKVETEVKFSFAVPSGASSQFLNIRNIRISEGACGE